jgi:GT2 family glycosyltransferase
LLEICQQAQPARDVRRGKGKARRVAGVFSGSAGGESPPPSDGRNNEDWARQALALAFESAESVIDLPAHGLTVPAKLFSDETLAISVAIPESGGINFAMPVSRGKTIRWPCYWQETETASTVLIKLGTYQRLNQCALELRLTPLDGSAPYQARLWGAEVTDNYYAAFTLDRPLLPGGYICELSSPEADNDQRLLAVWLSLAAGGSLARPSPAPAARHPPATVIVCVHNALEDTRRCLESVQANTSQPYRLMVVDDGSSADTQAYLRRHASQYAALLSRNEQALGYTRAANQGLRLASDAPYVVLLNSDTIVPPGWLDRLLACAESDTAIGMVGPFSNTASWQSIPEIERDGDWAANPLPLDLSVDQMAMRVAGLSARLYPRLPFLNGFCLLIKRQVIEDIGFFDAESFPNGYGEENDYCIRARKSGWQLAVADDTYIYHAQSKSYSHERRKLLADQAWAALTRKHEVAEIESGVQFCRHSRVMQGIRLRARLLMERWNFIEQGQYRWHGKRLAFILPIHEAGGGSNVVIMEARAMRRMGVDACILNLRRNQMTYEKSYPKLDVPIVYFEHPGKLPALCREFDAVIATANFSVEWIAPLADAPGPILGYYIQDFEPYFYIGKPNSQRWFWRSPWLRRRYASYYFRKNQAFRNAWLSYLCIPRIIRFTKTAWNQAEIQYQTGQSCARIGLSCDIDLFMPRRERQSGAEDRISIAAMVRPSSPRRGALRTMLVLRQIQQAYPGQVNITIFGTPADDPLFLALPRDFVFTNLGHLPQEEIALLFNETDIFADFSVYQAMGLTAMEAMACGVAVILPQAGGSEEFAVHEKNALLVDTHSFQACYAATERLVNQPALRRELAEQAYIDIPACYPERTAYRILHKLFDCAERPYG